MKLTDSTNLRLGANAVVKAYLGANLAWSPPSTALPRLTRPSTGQIQQAGTPWRTAGVNLFQIVLNDYPSNHLMSHTEIDSLLDKAAAMGCQLVRAHTLGINIGSNSYNLVTGVTGTGASTAITYNVAVWDTMDYVIAAARQRGIYLMVPMTDELAYYHGGKRNWVNFRRPGTCSTDPNVKSANSSTERAAEDYFYTDSQINTDFQLYIANWLGRVNQITGIAYGDDPTIAIIETGNEIWTSASFPTWGPNLATYIKTRAPNVLVADGSATDGQSLVAQHLASSALDIHGTHPYTTFDGSTVTSQAIAAEDAGKAYLVGEYGWSKSTAAAIEAAAEARPNVVATAFWSLQNDSDLHSNGNAYGTDDVSLYYPGKDATQTAAVSRLQAHDTAMNTIATPGSNRPTYSDTFDGTGAIDTTKFATALTSGSTVARSSDVLVMTTGSAGGYADKVTVASKAPMAADRTIKLDLTPADTSEAYLRIWLRDQSSEAAAGTLDFGGDSYWVEINSFGNFALFKRVAGTQTTLVAGTAISGFAAGVTVHFEATVQGSAITLRVYTGSTRPSTASATVTDTSVTGAGYFGFVLANGNAKTARTWRADNWSIA